MRARGLKLVGTVDDLKPASVAPHAGAWIETRRYRHVSVCNGVAPHAGAWIETAHPLTTLGDI